MEGGAQTYYALSSTQVEDLLPEGPTPKGHHTRPHEFVDLLAGDSIREVELIYVGEEGEKESVDRNDPVV